MRINLQAPAGCPAALLDCAGLPLLNQLDGFSVNPRITVCFSADVDTNSIPDGIRFIPYSAAGPVVGINQILYDQPSHCVFAKPDRVLNQQTRYLLTVSNSVTAGGAPIAASDEFQACLSQKDTYCRDLSAAAKTSAGKVSGQIVSASLFTTLSATTWLEQARQNAVRSPSVLLPAGITSTFKLANVKSMKWFPQDNSGAATSQDIPLPALSGVDRIAFGLYLSPNYLQLSGSSFGTILNTPTNKPIAAALPLPVSYHVFLPPVSGNARIPVVIYGHGLSDNQFGAPTYIASTLASQGFATLAIEIPGHGFGPASHVQITNSDNSTSIVLTPGRGGKLLQTTPISSDDGCVVSGPLAVRDCARQTAVDLFALVHAIQQTNGL
ncbi:MAG TPA: Ig-like domain-containing protein, partial [Bryobacteraceae bacterium]|nr:Ig-like domain-containing protein [Bryobacteraceae bacterium]